MSKLVKEKGLSPNFRKYFVPIHIIKELIYCLADIGISEDNISKRICFCQTWRSVIWFCV